MNPRRNNRVSSQAGDITADITPSDDILHSEIPNHSCHKALLVRDCWLEIQDLKAPKREGVVSHPPPNSFQVGEFPCTENLNDDHVFHDRWRNFTSKEPLFYMIVQPLPSPPSAGQRGWHVLEERL